jgi:hypothetical protein
MTEYEELSQDKSKNARSSTLVRCFVLAFSRTRTQHRGTRTQHRGTRTQHRGTRTRSQVDRHRVVHGQRFALSPAPFRVRVRGNQDLHYDHPE